MRPFGASVPPATDATLIALERQFNAVSKELLAVERLYDDRKRYQSHLSPAPEQSTKNARSKENTGDEDLTHQIEMILTRLDPIEQAIMQTQACTIGAERESPSCGPCDVPVLGKLHRST